VRNRPTWQILASVLAGLSASALVAGPAAGQPAGSAVAQFYRGNSIRLVVGADATGEYDATARLLARHLSRHLPGSPKIVVQNMPGASGIKSANYLAALAPRDGTVLATFNKSMPLYESTRLPNTNYKSAQFNWIGSLTHSNNLVVVAGRTGVMTLQDAKAREVTMGSIGAGGTMSTYPLILNNALGTRFRLVQGYASGNLVDFALERGEVDGRGSYTWADLKAKRAQWLRDGTVHVLVQFGLEREPDLARVPLATDLGGSDIERAAFGFLSSDIPIGKPFLLPPQVPPERVAAMRRAFSDALADPALRADAAASGVEIKPVAGHELQDLVQRITATAPAVVGLAERWMTER
jgi:tripartite-type tricarboxylate transporter receptor subunit TctC